MKRAEFTERTKLATLMHQRGVCRHCPALVSRDDAEFDHILPAAEGGDNSPSNCQALCVPCHDRKTFGTKHRRDGDNSKHCKSKRLAVKTAAFRARLADPDRNAEPTRSKRKWPSRPFPKRKDRPWAP